MSVYDNLVEIDGDNYAVISRHNERLELKRVYFSSYEKPSLFKRIAKALKKGDGLVGYQPSIDNCPTIRKCKPPKKR